MSAAEPATVAAPASHVPRPLIGPAIALALALGLAVLAFLVFPLDRALVAAFVAGVLVVLSASDIQRGIIPNRIVLPASSVALVAQIVLFPDRALEWTLAPLVMGLAIALPQLLGRPWMGMGDAKLVLLIGVTLGWGVLGSVLLAFVCVLPVALVLAFRRGAAVRHEMIPFGPFLSLGALIILFLPYLAGLSAS